MKKNLAFPFLLFVLLLFNSCEKDPEVKTIEYVYLGIDSVTATSVYFHWTQSHSDIFQSYQVHYSKKQRFAPSSGTLYKIFSNRYTTSTSVDTLVTNQPYYFRVRLVKSDATVVDSEEESAIPK